MKRALLVAIVLSLAWASVTGAEEVVFRSLHWGDGLASLGESVDVTTEEDRIAGYEARQKVDEDYALGPLNVASIVYGFFQGRLAMIMITASDAKMLSQIARAKYGTPFDSNAFVLNEFYRRGDTICNVKENLVLKTGVMTLASISMMEEYKRWQKQQAEAASKAF